jgi:hypothetical protein
MSAPTRDVQSSLWPEIRADKPVGPILSSVFTGTNAELIAAVAPYYLTGSVLDVTYGEGKWWDRYRPDSFTFHDLEKVDGVDFRALPHEARAFDAVTFDPPYVTSGGTATSKGADAFRGRYGIDRVTSYGHESELTDLVLAGLAECARVSHRWVLVKCMEFVSSRRFHDMPHTIKVAGYELGLSIHDVIVHHTGPGPGSHNIYAPLRARRHHSYLLVFEVAA